jgi:hypothetical protein
MNDNDRTVVLTHLNQIHDGLKQLTNLSKQAIQAFGDDENIDAADHLVNEILWSVYIFKLPALLRYLHKQST